MSILSKKDKYRIFCNEELLMPIFMQDWWLDAVCIAGEWDVCLVEKSGKVLAAWPYYVTKTGGVPQVNMPLQTKFAGPWFSYPAGLKNHSKLAWEKDVLYELISLLPKLGRFRQNFHYRFTNWLPLYWKGFSQTTYYSYRIPPQQDLDAIYAGFKSSVKNKIQKAMQQVEIKPSSDFEGFKGLLKKTALAKGISNILPDRLLDNVDAVCRKKQTSTILSAVDHNGVSVAAIYLVWDSESVYYLLSGMDQQYKSTEANTLLVWEGIKFAMGKNRTFDFEGSMIEGIEHFFRSFGAEQTPYFFISKTNFLPFRLLDALQNRH